MNIEEAKSIAKSARDQYAAGNINYGQAEKEIAHYKQLFNERSEELAAKYNQKPQRFRIGDFLKYKF